MHEEEIKNIPPEGRAQIAVAFLMKQKDERPEGSEFLFKKLEKFDESLRTIMTTMADMKETMRELYNKNENLQGSIAAVVELIVEGFIKDEAKIMDWCKRFDPPKNIDDLRPKRRNETPAQPDIAGVTAKNFKPQIEKN